MEREVWRVIVSALRRVPRRRPARGVYLNREILAVLLWAALHDRPVSWACERVNWPMQAWRRRLPDQSTMSRRLRDPALLDDLGRVLGALREGLAPSASGAAGLLLDGKALEVSGHSTDPDAAKGRGTGRFALGYRLHALIDSARRVLAWSVEPLNKAECVVARDLVRDASSRSLLPRGAMILADAGYDSNALYAAASDAGVALLAPRRKPHRSISPTYDHHPDRLHAIETLEGDATAAQKARAQRTTIERYFGALASVGGGLFALPPWVRRLRRVRLWVAAKLALDAARRVARRRDA